MFGAYSDDFKERVLRVARLEEYSKTQIARAFEISPTCLSNWIRVDSQNHQRPKVSDSEKAATRDFFQAQELATTLFYSLKYAHEEIEHLTSLNKAFMRSWDNIAPNTAPPAPDDDSTHLKNSIDHPPSSMMPIPSSYNNHTRYADNNDDDNARNNDGEFFQESELVEKCDNITPLHQVQQQDRGTVFPLRKFTEHTSQDHHVTPLKPHNSTYFDTSHHNENKSNKTTHKKSTSSTPKKTPLPILAHDYEPQQLRELLVIDITQTSILNCQVYVIFISDACSRRILHFIVSKTKPQAFPHTDFLTTLMMYNIDPQNVIGYNDEYDNTVRTVQIAYTAAALTHNIAPPFGIKCNTKISAIVRSILALYYNQVIYSHEKFRTPEALEAKISSWVSDWNTKIRHSGIGRKTVADYEASFNQAIIAGHPLPKLHLVRKDET